MVVGLSGLTNHDEGLRYSPACYESNTTNWNIHLPQSLQTRNELAQLAAVPYQILSPKDSKPIVSIVQDVALGVYRMTKSGVAVNEKQLFNLLATNPRFLGRIPEPAIKSGDVKRWTGRQLLTSIIPPNVNYKGANKSFDEKKQGGDKENIVEIKHGELVSGRVDTTIYQSRTKGIIHSIYNEYGPEETRVFFDNTQQLICNWLVLNGFSVGISDLVVDEDTNMELKNIIHDMKVKVYDKVREIHEGNFKNDSRSSNNDKFEEEVNRLLNEATNKAGKTGLSKIDDKTNRMINMIKAGAKGNPINIAQMIACLGQQNIDGKRIAYGYDDRTLPHYTKFDDGPEARGFVENSFIKGLSPQEFFFHSMGGREGLIDTAVKSVTGDTPIIIIENGKCKYVNIGDWIDAQLEHSKESVAYYPEDRHLELLNISNNVYIPTTDEDGKVTWGEVTAITRHDPGTQLYQIKTLGGKSVIVTESKSLLIWHPDVQQFKEVLTPDIRIGDFVPVTASLVEPPIIVDHIDMCDYFPKTEYVYGTEFNKAVDTMKTAMEGREKIPAHWWNAHNGTTFTLPYNKKSSLARATSGRSNTANIIDGCLYPYHAARETSRIPDKFELNKKNGIFIGLFLAEGNVHAGNVSITNMDIGVKQFVKDWFDTHAINHQETSRINKAGGTSSSVIGHSILLAKFITKLVGSGSRKKHVPDVAFIAPEEFVVGLLSGYFSGDGTISKTSVEAGSASKRLTEGISMLCTRIGSFGKVFTTQTKSNNFGTIDIAPSHRISIRGQWAKVFQEKVDLIVESKDKQLKDMQPSDKHRNFDQHNDVVLDKIVEINIMGVENYPKMYDLTIPSTLNFGLANGLQVRDTSSTGYIQRKLVKAMEDCKVSYDMTVRNANGAIVQFLYGEDGMDAVKIEHQPLPYIMMTPDELENNYLISVKDDLSIILDEDTFKSFKSSNWEKPLEDHFKHLCEDREFVIRKLFNGEQETSILYPVSFLRILTNTEALLKKYKCNGILSDLNPLYVLEEIDKLCDELFLSANNKGNKLISILIRMYLTPKQMIVRYGFTKDTFQQIVQQVKMRFFDSMVNPSEMVGVVAAQSIGEPCTQMTLNTFHLSGVSSASKAVRGVPRIEELTRVTKNVKAPSMTIYVKPEYNQHMEKCMEIKNKLEITTFKNVVKSSKIYYEPDDLKTNIENDRDFIKLYEEYQLDDNENDKSISPWLLRVEVDKAKMLDNGLTMIDLHHCLKDHYQDNISCMFSDDNSNQLIFRIKLVEQDEKEKSTDKLTDLKALEGAILESIKLKGIERVNKVELQKKEGFKYDDLTKTFAKSYEWTMDTDGTNLIETLGNPFIDATRTVSNDVNEVYAIFGIEAARQCLFNELESVMKDAEASVNFRHLSILVDTMTHKGTLMSIDRHGINKGDIGPLAKCSFEEVNDVLIKAGVFAEVDRVNGVASNIMLGQIAPCGTGDTDILIDEKKLKKPSAEQLDNTTVDMSMLDLDEDTRDQMCSIDNLTFDFAIPEKDETIVKKDITVKFV